jgi:hypothetical protein
MRDYVGEKCILLRNVKSITTALHSRNQVPARLGFQEICSRNVESDLPLKSDP